MAKILLVEDNEMNRDMLSRRLIKRGYEVTVAVDGEEGVRMAQDLQPDLVLMDVSLPIIDGFEATRRIKGYEITAKIPVIILTAHATNDDKNRALEAGGSDFDTKPVDFDRLVQKINKLLNDR